MRIFAALLWLSALPVAASVEAELSSPGEPRTAPYEQVIRLAPRPLPPVSRREDCDVDLPSRAPRFRLERMIRENRLCLDYN